MTTQAVRELITRHAAGAAALAALAAALDARVTGAPLEPALAARVDELLGALGATDALADLSAPDAAPLLAELRFMHGIEGRLMHTPARASGWTHTDPDLLRAPGAISGAQATGISRLVVPQLDGLGDRLAAPGAAFLDVGVGVAGLAIAMARLWPQLRVLGIDVWAPSLAIARANLAASEVGERIELRERRAEELEDEAAFDLAWIPVAFLPEAIVPAACAQVRRTLRPGGWVLLATTNPGGDAITAALARLRTTLFGGGAFSPAQLEGVLRGSGYIDARTIAGPPGSPMAFVAARRPA